MDEILGLIGVGSMGGPVAHNLLRRGERVLVHDRSQAAVDALIKNGAERADTPRAVASAASIVFICLPSLEAIDEVVFGQAGILHGSELEICVNLSTTGRAFIEDLGRRLAAEGIMTLDCPITGGAAAARDAALSITVSGPCAGYDRVKPLLDCTASHVFYVGSEPGQAQVMKLLNNMLSFAAFVASCEAFVLGVKAGLDPDAMVAVINTGTGRNSATTDKFPNNVLPRTFDYGAKLAISNKDISLCLEEAGRLGVPLWLAPVIKQIIGFAITQDGDQNDITTLIKHYEKWSGVEVTGAAGRSVKGAPKS